MAKYVKNFNISFQRVKSFIENNFLNISSSITKEDEEVFSVNEISCALIVYERYSFLGGNRVSLSVMIVGNSEASKVTMITSGGSQAVFFKLNTIGEESFLDSAIKMLDNLK